MLLFIVGSLLRMFSGKDVLDCILGRAKNTLIRLHTTNGRFISRNSLFHGNSSVTTLTLVVPPLVASSYKRTGNSHIQCLSPHSSVPILSNLHRIL